MIQKGIEYFSCIDVLHLRHFFSFQILNCKMWHNINLVLLLVTLLTWQRLGNFNELTFSSALLMKMVVIVLSIVGIKTKVASINNSSLFEVFFHDFSSWTIARGERGYKQVHFFLLHTILFCKSTLKATIARGLVQSRQPLCILTSI